MWIQKEEVVGGEEGARLGGEKEREEGLQTGHHWRPRCCRQEVQQDTWWLGPRSRPVFGWESQASSGP